MFSTSVASNASGAPVARQAYYAYGAVRASQGTLPTDYTFTGQKVDASAGLMYYGARYYDAALGRFIQPDTIIPDQFNPQSLNRYAYVYNNPLRYKDPSGHFPVDWLIDIASIIFDIHQLATEPSWENAGWLAVDVVLGITPYVPAGAGPAAKTAKVAGATAKSVDIVRATSKADEAVKAGEAFAKAAKLVGDIDAARQLIKEAGKEGKVIVIGRTMNPRVSKIAERLGAKTFPGDPTLKGKALLDKNLEWLQKMIDEGYVIVDVGADSSRGPLKPGEIDLP